MVVSLTEPAAADVAAQGPMAEKVQVKKARAQQDAVIASATSLDRNARVLGRTGMATNVVMLTIDAGSLAALAADPAVVSIKPVVDYQMSLHETVPQVGATAVQYAGFTGNGVRVAVLDSGIDYTHAAFGGPGTKAGYEAAYGTAPADARNTTLDGLFPTTRVVGGYDFVGEAWGAARTRLCPISTRSTRRPPLPGSAPMAATAPTSPTSSAAQRASPRARRCTPSRCARLCRPPAAASPSFRR